MSEHGPAPESNKTEPAIIVLPPIENDAENVAPPISFRDPWSIGLAVGAAYAAASHCFPVPGFRAARSRPLLLLRYCSMLGFESLAVVDCADWLLL